VTHFQNPDSHFRDNRDLDFFRRYLINATPQDAGGFSFRLGYFFHLVTDNLWSHLVGRPTKERFPEQFAANPKFIWEVKDDWYGLDFYLHPRPTRIVVLARFSVRPTRWLRPGFFAQTRLEHQLNHIKTFYQRQDEEIQAAYQRPYIYLSQADVDNFVTEATDRLFRVYQLLWPVPPDLAGKSSALELL